MTNDSAVAAADVAALQTTRKCHRHEENESE